MSVSDVSFPIIVSEQLSLTHVPNAILIHMGPGCYNTSNQVIDCSAQSASETRNPESWHEFLHN